MHSFTEMCAFSQNFLGLPYTWGGRSSFGYDCSGFVQMLYRQMGIFLPRDSKDQCHWSGFREILEGEIDSGDLIFFGSGINKITHVGMYLEKGKFIHATVAENMPYIRTSSIESVEWRNDGKGRFPFQTIRRLNY